MDKYKVTVLGAGGHGLSSLSHLLKEQDIDFDVIYSTADWGGSTGLWGRLLEYNENELNLMMHKTLIPILPLGDPNKLICGHLESFGKPAKKFLDFRSNVYSEHLEKIKNIRSVIDLPIPLVKDFARYFTKIWNFYAINQPKIRLRREFCLGYALLYYLVDQLGDWQSLNSYLRDIEALPRNINFDFASEERQILVAKDISLERFVGEDKIDKHRSPFVPQSMLLLNQDNSIGQVKPQLIKTINESDLIIIPTGSISNWLSIVNYRAVQNALKKKKIVWITNPFKTKNELQNSNYLSYFHELNLHPIGYGTKNNTQRRSFFPTLLQDKQGKYFPKQITTIVKNHLRDEY